MISKKAEQKDLLYDAAWQYSNFGIIKHETVIAILGEKPADRKSLNGYYKHYEKLIRKVAILAARM